MFEKTKNQSIWCDNGHEPFQMIFLTILFWTMVPHIFVEKIVKESAGNGKISIEWVKKPIHTKRL